MAGGLKGRAPRRRFRWPTERGSGVSGRPARRPRPGRCGRATRPPSRPARSPARPTPAGSAPVCGRPLPCGEQCSLDRYRRTAEALGALTVLPSSAQDLPSASIGEPPRKSDDPFAGFSTTESIESTETALVRSQTRSLRSHPSITRPNSSKDSQWLPTDRIAARWQSVRTPDSGHARRRQCTRSSPTRRRAIIRTCRRPSVRSASSGGGSRAGRADPGQGGGRQGIEGRKDTTAMTITTSIDG